MIAKCIAHSGTADVWDLACVTNRAFVDSVEGSFVVFWIVSGFDSSSGRWSSDLHFPRGYGTGKEVSECPFQGIWLLIRIGMFLPTPFTEIGFHWHHWWRGGCNRIWFNSCGHIEAWYCGWFRNSAWIITIFRQKVLQLFILVPTVLRAFVRRFWFYRFTGVTSNLILSWTCVAHGLLFWIQGSTKLEWFTIILSNGEIIGEVWCTDSLGC